VDFGTLQVVLKLAVCDHRQLLETHLDDGRLPLHQTASDPFRVRVMRGRPV
jgi:hypothetical protein